MKWFKKRRQKLISDIANEVVKTLENSRGWEKFLPPVVVRDTMYMVTEDGKIYAMRYDMTSEMEMIIKIRS